MASTMLNERDDIYFERVYTEHGKGKSCILLLPDKINYDLNIYAKRNMVLHQHVYTRMLIIYSRTKKTN